MLDDIDEFEPRLALNLENIRALIQSYTDMETSLNNLGATSSGTKMIIEGLENCERLLVDRGA
jgi:hypothetical protein